MTKMLDIHVQAVYIVPRLTERVGAEKMKSKFAVEYYYYFYFWFCEK